MKNKLIITITYLLLGILIFITPIVIFPVCPGKMNCFYTGQAEIGTGAIIAVLGLVSFFLNDKTRAGISIGNAAIGALVIFYPLNLIGVCGGNMMICHMATKPMLLVLGVITILVSLANTIYLLKKEDVNK